MGFGDPYHEHPLGLRVTPGRGANCSRCELPIISDVGYGCIRCNHWIHKWCGELPETMRHPLHDRHPLVLLAPPPLSDPGSSAAITASSLCNGCHSPCLGGFVYHCPACQFILHLKCFRTLEHKKHGQHPLSLTDRGHFGFSYDCRVCGHGGACLSCEFYIHFECSLVPQTVKHHHVHELNFEYNYPEESDLAYCDVCEDKDGKELDRSLSYYYCKKCDYVAHVRCVTTPPGELETVQLKHEHPLKFSQKHKNLFARGACNACGTDASDTYYSCTQCEHIIHKSCVGFPSLIKHPLHKEHALALDEHSRSFLHCTACEFTLQLRNALIFNHPYHQDHQLWFSNSNSPFRCNACGDLGKGFRMQCQKNNYRCNFDLHLECFALPVEIEHEKHLHQPLFLCSYPVESISQ